MRMSDPDMSVRFVEEFYKRDIGVTELARKLGCSAPVVGNWVYCSGMPSQYYLRRLHHLGFDIMYILTGERHV